MLTFFRLAGIAGTLLLGAALVIAPVAAFENRMTIVSALGIAGIVLLLVAWLLRRIARGPAQADEPRQNP